MSKQESQAKLEELDRRLAEGWKNLNSVKESQLEAIRDVIREEWGEQQKEIAAQRERSEQRRTKRQSQEQTQIKRLDHKRGMTH